MVILFLSRFFQTLKKVDGIRVQDEGSVSSAAVQKVSVALYNRRSTLEEPYFPNSLNPSRSERTRLKHGELRPGYGGFS